jgi:beta-glucosidase
MSAGAAAVPSFGQAATQPAAAMPNSPVRERSFPEGFLWGSATASYQVEGAVHADGRGASIWDTFSHTPGKTHNGDTGDVADDYYHRYKEDIALMRDLGLKTCRFSIAWTRIFPNGTGAPNPKGLDFYDRMVDELLAQGIQPYCTLYHWDLPQALEDKGGWQNRDTAVAFADYAGYTAGHLSDRIKHFMTVNELRTFTELGYRDGTHAPGVKVDAAQFAQVCHYAVLGHGLAVQAIRAKAKAGTQVGLADNITPAVPVIENAENIAAAEKGIREMNAMFLTVIQEGKYTDGYLRRLGKNAPKFTAEELQIIGSKLDFTGINIYQPTWVRAPLDSEKQGAPASSYIPDGFTIVEPPSSYPHMFSSWLTIGPEALYWGPKLVNKLWEKNAIYITENGTSSADVIAPDGHVWDTDRVMFLRAYLTQLQRAVADGVPVKGYFLWSLLDNYEWADGYEKRFGITYVDFQTQKRTPKLSSYLYKEIIKRNALA